MRGDDAWLSWHFINVFSGEIRLLVKQHRPPAHPLTLSLPPQKVAKIAY